MNEYEYDSLKASVEAAFSALYEIDVRTLEPEQRKQHQEELATVYLAVVRIENRRFADLSAEVIKKLQPLKSSAETLQNQLYGLKSATEILQTISGALNALTSIAKLLK